MSEIERHALPDIPIGDGSQLPPAMNLMVYPQNALGPGGEEVRGFAAYLTTDILHATYEPGYWWSDPTTDISMKVCGVTMGFGTTPMDAIQAAIEGHNR